MDKDINAPDFSGAFFIGGGSMGKRASRGVDPSRQRIVIVQAINRPDDEATPDESGDGKEFPRDIDKLRAELARRLEALIGSRTEAQERPAIFRRPKR